MEEEWVRSSSEAARVIDIGPMNLTSQPRHGKVLVDFYIRKLYTTRSRRRRPELPPDWSCRERKVQRSVFAYSWRSLQKDRHLLLAVGPLAATLESIVYRADQYFVVCLLWCHRRRTYRVVFAYRFMFDVLLAGQWDSEQVTGNRG